MPNANIVILIGNLTRDPQLSYTPNQTAITEFGIAVNRQWKKDGQKHEEVCFVDCKAFGVTGENVNKYLSKGDPVFIQGRLAFEQWEAQDGRKCSKHRVIVESLQFLGKAQQEESGRSEAGSARAPISDDEQSSKNVRNDDDIPF